MISASLLILSPVRVMDGVAISVSHHLTKFSDTSSFYWQVAKNPTSDITFMVLIENRGAI